jgi:hypothetical protein
MNFRLCFVALNVCVILVCNLLSMWNSVKCLSVSLKKYHLMLAFSLIIIKRKL